MMRSLVRRATILVLLGTLFVASNLAPAQEPDAAELAGRVSRTPEQVARELTAVYGKELKQVAYIPALAVVGRVRFAEQTKNGELRREVEQVLAPFVSGERKPVPKSGSEQAGHLLFSEMARRTAGQDRETYIRLVRAAADQIFDEQGQPRELMPFHNEMSDAVFMAGPILAAAGKLTGEAKYFDACARHIENMQKLCLRGDGLYRHSPLCEAAWGRGNGFPALGLVLVLDDFPADHPAREKLLKSCQSHLTTLLKYQDESGCWRQVIDEPESYREFSAACMIGFAIERGMVRGWLDAKPFRPAAEKAWEAVKARIGPGGKLEGVCEGTGKQKTLEDYFRRKAIFGVDPRGGAMALLFATERMR
jgi:rhamnogalacturonyl hydrolase YesR